MRMFAVAADLAMGAVLGIFLYAALGRTWPAVQHPVVAGVIVLASIARADGPAGRIACDVVAAPR